MRFWLIARFLLSLFLPEISHKIEYLCKTVFPKVLTEINRGHKKIPYLLPVLTYDNSTIQWKENLCLYEQ